MSRRIRVARFVLIAVGVLGLAIGAAFLVTTVPPKGLTGLAVWLAAAIVLHDGILAPGGVPREPAPARLRPARARRGARGAAGRPSSSAW